MKRTNWLLTGAVAAGLALSSVGLAQNQDNGGAPPGGMNGGGGGGGGNRPDPAQMRENMLTRVKEQMQANDDEWNVIKPKVEKVMEAQRDVPPAGGGMGMMRRPGGGGGGGGQGGGGGGGNRGGGGFAAMFTNPDAEANKARTALTEILANTGASNEDITAKMTAFREARDKAKMALTGAQKDLKDVLSPRQEAVAVSSGMLD